MGGEPLGVIYHESARGISWREEKFAGLWICVPGRSKLSAAPAGGLPCGVRLQFLCGRHCVEAAAHVDRSMYGKWR